MLKAQPLLADSSIFGGSSFPKVDFLNKELVIAAVGPYSLHVRFFDALWNEVTIAQTTGRYGALIEFNSGDGQTTFTSHLTLFKTSRPYVPAKDPYAANLKFPESFGLPASTLAQEKWNVSDWTGGALDDAVRKTAGWAMLVAGLHDIARDPVHLHGFSVWKINNDWWSELQKRLGENQDYPHLTYLPDGYDKEQRAWPVIFFLHGSGERGSELSKLKNQGPLGYIHTGHPLPFIVITPQCPEDEHWNAERLSRLIDQVEATDRVDTKRIYLTGLSMGGFGTFDLAATYPNKFAAIAPLSGGEDPDLAGRLKNTPAWVFHGSEDTVVPTSYSANLVYAMQKLGAPVKLTIYPHVGHGDWDKTYSDPDLYTWFLGHSR